MTQLAMQTPKQNIWYVAPSYKQAKNIMWQMLREVVPQVAIVKRHETDLFIRLKNGSEIYLKGADNPDSLRGVRIDFCVFDECAFIDKWQEVWKVVRPTLVDSKADVWFISTPNGFNHFKQMAETQDEGWQYFHFTSYDNPYIDHEELEKAKESMDEDSFEQEFMGEFRKMKGLIYKDFNRDIHLVDLPGNFENYTFYRSLDFGFGHNTALGYFAVSSDQTAIYMYDGLYRNEIPTEQLADNIRMKDGGRFITNAWADSAQPQIIDDLRHKGINFTPVEKGAGSVIKGIADVAELLKVRKDTGKPTLMFAKHLTWVADEAEKYRWIMNKNESTSQRELPRKRDDDAMAMIRYFAMSYIKPMKKQTNAKSGDLMALWGPRRG
jgi:PBSX family phage terminase large subunit